MADLPKSPVKTKPRSGLPRPSTAPPPAEHWNPAVAQGTAVVSSGTSGEVHTMPADWNALFTEDAPTPTQGLRMVLMAVTGEGKTHFCATNPRALILDYENKVPNIPRPPRAARHILIESWDVQERIMTKLMADADANRRVFDHVVFDTGSAWFGLAVPWCEENKFGGQGVSEWRDGRMGWYVVRDQMMRPLWALARAGYGWTVTIHLIKTDSGFKTNIPPTTVDRLREICNVALVLQRVKTPTMTLDSLGDRGAGKPRPVSNQPRNQYYLYADTQKLGDLPMEGKAPYMDHMPDQMELKQGWADWDRVYTAALLTATRGATP